MFKKVNCKPTLLPNHLDFIMFNHHVEGKEKNLISKHGSGLQQRSQTPIKKGKRPVLNTQTFSKNSSTDTGRHSGWQEKREKLSGRATWP